MARYERGVCENVEFYNLWIEKDPLFKGLVVRNVDIYPFNENWTNLQIATMTYLLTYGRSLVLGNGVNPNTDKMYAVTLGELIGPELPVTLFLNQNNAREMLVSSVNALAKYPRISTITRTTVDTYTAWVNSLPIDDNIAFIAESPILRGFLPADYPTAERDITTPFQAMRVLYHMAMMSSPLFRIGGLNIIANITVGIAKRGILSAQFVTKIEQGIEADLGKTITINQEALKIFYNNFGEAINDLTVRAIFDRWTQIIPTAALRLILTVRQAIGGGLTSFLVIGEAMLLYPSFYWNQVSLILPEDWRRYAMAVASVGTNKYYGFKKELGPAKSTLFKSLAYVAKELLVKVGGKVTLNQYAGWTRRPIDMVRLDQLVVDYQGYRSTLLTEEGLLENEPIVQEMLSLVDANRAVFIGEEEEED